MANPFKDFTVSMRGGEVVYQEGEPGAMMYVIQAGSVELVRTVDGQEVSYGLLEKGDFFGEMSLLLESQPRTTSAVVRDTAVLVEIDSTIFDRMIRGNIEIAVRMMRKLSLRLRELQDRPVATPQPVPPVEDLPPPEATVEPAASPPRPAPAPPPPTSFPEGTFAIFATEDGATQFPMRADSIAIGRFDPVTGMRPEVDLSAVDINRSVSRHHARLQRNGTEYTLTEEVGALNGTFINGGRLTTGKPAAVRDGDEVGLGMVRLRFQVLPGR